MKTKITILILLSVFLLLYSCTVTNNATSNYKSVKIQRKNVYQIPVVADLKVDEKKVTGTALKLYPNQPLIEVQNMAISDALNKAKADILIEPTFEIITENQKTTVTVTGYSGTYKNFRNLTEDDIKLIQLGYSKIIEQQENEQTLKLLTK